MADPWHHGFHTLIMGFLWQIHTLSLWQIHTLSCVDPQLQPGPHARPFGLSLHSQTETSPQVCLLKLEFQHLTAAHTNRSKSQAGECGDVAWTISVHPSLPCLAASQLPYPPLEQIPDD